MITEYCQDKPKYGGCRKASCLKERTAYIYGLYDKRLHDILYVGSTFYPGQRFAEHISSAREPYNTKSFWLQAILESGSYPLPILLAEFQTMCDNYTRQVEGEIAAQLRVAGYTAIWDAYEGPSAVVAYHQAMVEKYPWEEYPGESRPNSAIHDVKITLYMEYIDRIAEQARVTRMLREMYQYG
jgi:hypothetical protein